MIIICSGPDTYRAREKAQELVKAFRVKHDLNGLATDVVDGSEGISVLLSRLAGASLFAPKKLIRADGCLAKMKIADVRTLAARLEKDKDQTIIVTVEEEPPAVKVLETLKAAPLFHYPFPLQNGVAFRAWVRACATARGVLQKTADEITAYAEGDSWLAIQELAKQAAHPQAVEEGNLMSGSIFDVADAVMTKRGNWRQQLDVLEDEGVISVALNQTRSYLRVRDGFSDGLHPYVAKKLGSLRVNQPEERFATLMKAFIASRSGLLSGKETQDLI